MDSARSRRPWRCAFRLQQGDANSIAQALRAGLTANVRAGEPAPTVTPEAGSNTIIVTGSADAMRRAEDLVAAMDEHVEVGGLGVRTIVLKHARAEAVAPLVERVLSQDRVVDLVPEWLRWQMVWELERRNRPVDLQRVRVQADDRLNAVVVSAPLELLDLAEEVASSLDVEPSGPRSAIDRCG
ncbi:MAG: secretin N-terminal domain-containing protein [Phycisphaerales bacterium]